MRRVSSLLAAVALACSVAGPATARPPSPADELAAIRQTIHDGGFKSCPTVRDRLVRLAADPTFESLAGPDQRNALYLVLTCLERKELAAIDAARRLRPLAVERQEIFAANLVLMTDARGRDDVVAYLDHFGAVADIAPDAVAQWNPLGFDWALQKTRDMPAAKLALLTRLRTLPWTAENARDGVDNGWALAQARLLIESGDAARAAAALERADAAFVLMEVAQDNRFAPLWPVMEKAGRFDWGKVGEGELARTRTRAAAAPAELGPVELQIHALRALGRHDEAVALGRAYADRLAKGEAFKRAAFQGPWLLNSYADALFDLGRFDEADAVMASAKTGDQVSHQINRAEMLSSAGKPRQALALLADVDESQSSPYGRMWRDAGKVCAHARLGEKDAAMALLPSMRERWKDNAAALTRALLCVDAGGEVAALYVRRLEDPAQRAAALQAFRVTRAPPVVTANAAVLDARRKAVLARPEVRAALAKHGRAIEIPLGETYWGAL